MFFYLYVCQGRECHNQHTPIPELDFLNRGKPKLDPNPD